MSKGKSEMADGKFEKQKLRVPGEEFPGILKN